MCIMLSIAGLRLREFLKQLFLGGSIKGGLLAARLRERRSRSGTLWAEVTTPSRAG